MIVAPDRCIEKTGQNISRKTTIENSGKEAGTDYVGSVDSLDRISLASQIA